MPQSDFVLAAVLFFFPAGGWSERVGTDAASTGVSSWLPILLGILGMGAGVAALFRVRSQNRKDRTETSELQRKGTYERLQTYVDGIEEERDYWKNEALQERKSITELTRQLSELARLKAQLEAQLETCVEATESLTSELETRTRQEDRMRKRASRRVDKDE